MKKQIAVFLCLVVCIGVSGCRSSAPGASAPSAVMIDPPQTASAQETEREYLWEEALEVINRRGDITTIYKQTDGSYIDRELKEYRFDGIEDWLCEDGTEWNKTLDQEDEREIVHAEFAAERLLAQRPDRKLYSDAAGSPYASQIVLFFDEDVTDFSVLALEGTFRECGDYDCTASEELYREERMTGNDLMVIETELGELLPTRGIQFTDSHGICRRYYLALSGEDNIPLLVRY